MADPTSVDRPARERRAPRTTLSRRTWLRELGWRHLVGIAVVIFAIFPLVYVLSARSTPAARSPARTSSSASSRSRTTARC